MSSLVRAAVLTNYLEVAQHLGLNPQSLLCKVGLSGKILSNPDQQISCDAAVTLLEESARETGCMTFGLLMAESRQLSDFGAVSLLLTHQRTLRNVLHTMIQYRHLLNESLAMYIEDAGKKVIIREELVTDFPTISRQAIELALGVLYRMCGALLGTHWHPYSVNFTHEAPPDLHLHRRIFRCPLEFGSEFNGIVCSADDLDYPNPTANPAMARYAERFIQTLPGANEHSIALEVRKAVYLTLPMGRATIEQIAQGLGLNVRSMQRQLKDGGDVFSDLVNEVRRDLVVRYMENRNYSLSRIAELLGFGVPSSFTRWFTSQYGVTPALWRKTLTDPQN